MQNEFENKKHLVSIDNRQAIELTGINDVPVFDENDVQLCSDFGDISIKGENMKVEELSLDSGIVKINGKITAIIYTDNKKTKGFFKRVFSS